MKDDRTIDQKEWLERNHPECRVLLTGKPSRLVSMFVKDVDFEPPDTREEVKK